MDVNEHVYYKPVLFFFILTFDLKFDLDYLKTTDTLRFVPHITL